MSHCLCMCVSISTVSHVAHTSHIHLWALTILLSFIWLDYYRFWCCFSFHSNLFMTRNPSIDNTFIRFGATSISHHLRVPPCKNENCSFEYHRVRWMPLKRSICLLSYRVRFWPMLVIYSFKIGREITLWIIYKIGRHSTNGKSNEFCSVFLFYFIFSHGIFSRGIFKLSRFTTPWGALLNAFRDEAQVKSVWAFDHYRIHISHTRNESRNVRFIRPQIALYHFALKQTFKMMRCTKRQIRNEWVCVCVCLTLIEIVFHFV